MASHIKSSDQLPVYARIAEKLEQQSGRDPTKSKPPSVRDVASQFSVSIVTASRALQVLKGKRSAAADLSVSSSAVGKWAVCLNVTPWPHQQQRAAGEVAAEGFRVVGRRLGVTFDFDTVHFGEDCTEAKLKQQLVASGARGVYLMPSRLSEETLRNDEALLAACRSLQLPVVLIERNLRGIDRPLANDVVTMDDFTGGRTLTHHFLQQQRQRIAFVTASPTSSHIERVGGYLSAMHEAKLEPVVLQYPHELSAKAAYMQLADQLVSLQIDAVICYHDYPAFGILMELLRRGINVPGAIGIAGYDNMPIGESYSIGITTFAFPGEEIAQRAMSLMEQRMHASDAPPVRVVVPGNLIVRESSATIDAKSTS